MRLRLTDKYRALERSAKEEGGQALIETAVSMTLLLLLFLGAAGFGSAVHVAIEVQDAAMAGVQYGAHNTTTLTDTTGIATAAANNALGLTGLQTTSSYTCICSDGTASTCQTTDCSSSHIEYILTVNTQATVAPMMHGPGLPSTFTIHGQAVQKDLQ